MKSKLSAALACTLFLLGGATAARADLVPYVVTMNKSAPTLSRRVSANLI